MAVKGDLTDISLPSLIEMLCIERRKAGLILRRRRIEEGVLFFDDGQIVHARAVQLTGDEAVFQLLKWSEGTFRMGDQVTVPRRTVHSSWRHLLLEGMKRIDEQIAAGGQCQQPEAATPAQKEQDRRLEYDLIHLLSRLENAYTRLAQKKNRKRPANVLQILVEMVNETAAFAETHLTGAPASLANTLSMTAETYPAARLLQTDENRLLTGFAKNLYNNWQTSASSRRQTFEQVAQGLFHVLETFFLHFVAAFHTPDLANQWRETCQLFLSTLSAAIKHIKF